MEISQVFNVNPQNVTLHLKNIYREKELEEKATCKESLQVQKEGNREVSRQVKIYNLDVIIVIGYRVNSVVGTNFRIWATTTLKQHILNGFTINKTRIATNYDAFMKAVETVKALALVQGNVDTQSVLELVQLFTDTWFSLNTYDKKVFIPGLM